MKLRHLPMFVLGAAIVILASGGVERALGGTPNPCELVTEDEAAGVMGYPLAEPPEYGELFGIQVCNWYAVPDEFGHSAQAGLQLFSGTDEGADLLYDGTIAPYEEEVDGLGDRAKWASQVIWQNKMWGELRIRAEQYYIMIYVEKYEPKVMISPTEAQEEMLALAQIVLSKLQPRAPVEFTQAIQELQDNYELVADLALNGEPPVPIVVGKPAVARVYFDEDSQGETRTVELSNVAFAQDTVTVGPGCTVEKQRRQEDGCQSADLYFTPPYGEWTAGITIKNGQGDQIDHMEFTMTSVETDPIHLRPVPVCDRAVNSVWECSSLADLAGLVPYVRSIFPAGVEVTTGVAQVKRDFRVADEPIEWWEFVLGALKSQWASAGSPSDAYYYGVVRPEDQTGSLGPGGAAILGGHAAAGISAWMRPSISGGQAEIGPDTLGHELGHNLGRGHAPSPASNGCYAQPATLDPSWPHGNSPYIDEVGFDVANQRAITQDKYAELMTYCNPHWISIYTYEAILDGLRPGFGVTAATSSTTGDFWLVSGRIDGLTASFNPLFETETTGEAGAGTGGYRLEVKGDGGSTLFTRLFTPDHAHAQSLEIPPGFNELIPVNPDAKLIQVYAPDNSLLGMITLEGDEPSVDVTLDGAQTAGTPDVITVNWTVTDADSAEHTAWVEFSDNGGASWETVTVGIEGNQLSVDVGSFPGTNQGMLRVRVSDGVNTGVGTSGLFTLPEKGPQAAITFPEDSTVYDAGSVVWLQGYAQDAEDGSLDADIMWTSSRDGFLGSGASLPVYDLSAGTHMVTLRVGDSDANETSASITIAVGVGSGVESVWGDNNCSGSADPVDSLLTLRFDAGLGTNTGDCPDLGQVVEVTNASLHPWGDVDCGGDVTPVDSLKLLRFDAGLSVSQEANCPEVGASVTIVEG